MCAGKRKMMLTLKIRHGLNRIFVDRQFTILIHFSFINLHGRK